MNFQYLFPVIAWTVTTIKLNGYFSEAAIIVSQSSKDPQNWIKTGKNQNLAQINSLFSITMEEERLNFNVRCTGKCDVMDDMGKFSSPMSLKSPNQCAGEVHRCWLYKETERRKKAQIDFDVEKYYLLDTMSYGYFFPPSTKSYDEAKYKLDHTGNTCKCLCERVFDWGDEYRGSLLDSLCFDPVSVHEGHVATGVRFKIHGKVIHLELQQAKLRNGRIVSTPEWVSSNKCKDIIPVASYFRWKDGKRFRIIAEDIVLSENAVVTGITLGQSIRGRYLTPNGNFDGRRSEFTNATHCSDEKIQNSYLRDRDAKDEHPRISTAVNNNYERSESCKTRIMFWETSAEDDDVQHVVPFIDLQQIVTNPPEPIVGAGWYLRGYPGYGGFLALKIFKHS